MAVLAGAGKAGRSTWTDRARALLTLNREREEGENGKLGPWTNNYTLALDRANYAAPWETHLRPVLDDGLWGFTEGEDSEEVARRVFS